MPSQFLLSATYGAKGAWLTESLHQDQITYSIDIKEGGGNVGNKEDVKINL